MRWAVIESAMVVNVIEADEPLDGLTMVQTDEAGIGWTWDGTAFSPPPPPPPTVPDSITARQLRLWLVRHNVALSAVEAALAALPEPSRTEAQIEWDYATQFERANPLLRQMAEMILGVSGSALDEALDVAFIEASAF